MIDNYVDLAVNVLAAYIAYFFSCLAISEAPPVVATDPLVMVVVLMLAIVSAFVYQTLNLYRGPAYTKAWVSYVKIIEANLIVFGIIIVGIAAFASDETRNFLTVWAAITFATSTVFWIFKRRISISVFWLLHRKQFVFRKVIIVGDNTAAAKDYVRQVADDPSLGVMVVGYVGDKITEDVGCDKLGSFRDLEKIIDKYKPTDVVFAIDAYNKRHLIKLVNMCDDRCIRVYFLPVIYGFFKSEKQIEQVGSLPLINIHTTPLDNKANAFAKRLVDIVGSLILIVVTAPIMLIAAIGTRLSSPGPVLFKQRRVGKMGKTFIMYKFRSMKVNDSSNVTWTTGVDERKTKFGTFIRRTAIDELPQLFNVLMGHMSLVGPRPELPKFVDEFKDTIPLYMVKHYVRPGMTGLAQVKGLRGDTSVEDRIHEDIAYIESWSFMLDIAILLKTPFKAFNKSEKYIEKEIKDHPELYGDPVPEMLEIQELLMGDDDEPEAEALPETASAPEQIAMEIGGEENE